MKRDGFRFRYAPSPAVAWLPAAVLAATSACASDEAPAQICDVPYFDCDGVCVALASDPDNCGACGDECSAGESCVNGACEGPAQGGGAGGGAGGPEDNAAGGSGGGVPDCGGERTMERCDGVCVDTRTDPDHCGKCGEQCDPGRACAGSLCQRTCLEGFTDCAGSCVDISVDPMHCGGCNSACDLGRPCEEGSCGCSVEPSEDIDAVVPQRVTGTTSGAASTRALSCSGSDAPDQTFLFTAPGAGTYIFDTFETPFDTVLGALSADTCAELACSDDAEGIQSQIFVDLAEGERILVVVSGASGAEGDFTLRLTQPGPVMCTPTALEPVVAQTVTGTTVGLEDAVSSDCDFTSSADATYTFTAPEAGAYVFSASASAELIVDVLEDGTCTGESLGCEDAFSRSTVMAELEAEETVLVAVSSPGRSLRSFTLDVFKAPPCPGQDLGSTVPQTVTGSNEGLADVLSACFVSTTGGEATYSFTAPNDGVYLFDTQGSSFPVLMDVRSGSCTGDFVTCADGEVTPARATVALSAGDTVVIVLDTYGETGTYQLAISEVPCPQIDLGSTAPQTVTGTTADFFDLLEPSCGYSGGPEATYRFTAPADGLYTFDTEGSTFDTILDVRSGSCAGPSIRCNDDVDPSREVTTSRVSVLLSADQTVIVSLDSNSTSGEYVLSVAQQEAPPCPLIELDSTVPQTVTGSNEGYPDLLTPECGSGSGGEATYGFTAPADGYYTIDTAGSSIETILSVREGGCGEVETDCVDGGTASRLLVWLDAGATIVISVDTDGAEGEYALNVGEFDGVGTCDAPVELEPVLPLTATGTTMGSLGVKGASCGGSSAPEVIHSFTAPETGTYVIDTFGSDYDTVLSVFDGDCSGEELDCSDDSPWHSGVTSELSVSLEAGQTILIVVDGYDRDSGPYELHVDIEP
ncbi:MXAN_6577-like cysteine-rich protein [Sorangium sp. So ce1099]|uniref:MXAN_6577-like cysteine-rich protein n=1 Tax=Sorangium sp. So ce1099 TaxID=3133331 RepID=UPI003F5DC734